MSCDQDSTRLGEMLMGANPSLVPCARDSYKISFLDLEFESAVSRNVRLDYTTTEPDRKTLRLDLSPELRPAFKFGRFRGTFFTE